MIRILWFSISCCSPVHGSTVFKIIFQRLETSGGIINLLFLESATESTGLTGCVVKRKKKKKSNLENKKQANTDAMKICVVSCIEMFLFGSWTLNSHWSHCYNSGAESSFRNKFWAVLPYLWVSSVSKIMSECSLWCHSYQYLASIISHLFLHCDKIDFKKLMLDYRK